MKVVLREEIANLGNLGAIVDVADGYARNYLIPRKLAEPATENAIKLVQQAAAKRAKELEKSKQEVTLVAEKLKNTPVTIVVKVGQEDKMFGSVTTSEIADELAKQNILVDHRKIRLEEPIRTLGNYTVSIKLHPEIVAELLVQVVKSEVTE
ncbi:MAG: 50S ribosomal protein L9 [bacterium]|nr:50S ribosomal protein L9 [bacterium]